ncbi:MAG: hypothetical protein ACAF41_06215 [Leptolyngbya sp. BL-A-14]
MAQLKLVHWALMASSLLSLAWVTSALGQPDLLTRAEVYKLVNTVQLLPNNQSPRPAKLTDTLAPLDAIKTATRSRAELLFNEGSLARVGANAIFRFVPGTRSFQLRNGTALIMSLPGKVGTRVETPGGQVLAQALPPSPSTSPPSTLPVAPPTQPLSLAMIVRFDAASNTTNVFALTNGSITVFDLKGGQVFLTGGQTVSIVNGVLGPVQTFDLKTFYKTSNLVTGLGPGQDALVLQETSPVQQTLKAVRVDTLAALEAQTRWLEGLCTLNGRGSGSTLATNCITTDANDPVLDFQDRREVTTPPRQVSTPPSTPPTPPPPTIPVTPPSNAGNNPTTGVPATGNNQPTGTVILIQGGNQAKP